MRSANSSDMQRSIGEDCGSSPERDRGSVGSNRRYVRLRPFARCVGEGCDEADGRLEAGSIRGSIGPEVDPDMPSHLRKLREAIEVEERIVNWPCALQLS